MNDNTVPKDSRVSDGTDFPLHDTYSPLDRPILHGAGTHSHRPQFLDVEMVVVKRYHRQGKLVRLSCPSAGYVFYRVRELT